jgi:chorismate mutase
VIEKVRTRASAAGLSPEIAERVYRTVIECFINKELLEFKEMEKDA